MTKKTTTVSPWQILKFFWGYYMQKKRLFRPLFLLRIVIPIVSLLPATYYKELVDVISGFIGEEKEALIPALMSIVLIIAGIQLLRIFLNKLSEILVAHLTMENIADISQDCFDYLQRHSYRFFTDAST